MGDMMFLSGNEIVVHAAIAAGCRFYGGYPITPSSEIAEGMARELPKVGGAFIQMEDEIAGIGASIGASIAGMKAMTATSGPGFSLKQEHIGYAIITEVPLVIVDVMRGGPSTGLPTFPSQADIMQARWGTHGGLPMSALMPATAKEIYTETINAFNLAERVRTPVILLLDEIIGHRTANFEAPGPDEIHVVDRKRFEGDMDDYLPYDTSGGEIPPFVPFFEGARYHITGLNHDATGFPTTDQKMVAVAEGRLSGKIERNREEIARTELYFMDDADIAIFAAGSVALAAMDAVREARAEGLRVGLIRPVTVWPFPERRLRRFSKRLEHIIVAELNLGQMIGEVERIVRGRVPVSGILRADGKPISPEMILAKIEEVY